MVNHWKFSVKLQERVQTKQIDWECCFSLSIPLKKVLSLQVNAFSWGLCYCRILQKVQKLIELKPPAQKIDNEAEDFHIETITSHLAHFIKGAQSPSASWLFLTSETVKTCCTHKVKQMQGRWDTQSPKIRTATLSSLFIYLFCGKGDETWDVSLKKRFVACLRQVYMKWKMDPKSASWVGNHQVGPGPKGCHHGQHL